MDKLSIYDAKARFSELLERVQSGHSTTITKRGRVPAIFAAEVTNVLVVLERRGILTEHASEAAAEVLSRLDP